VNLHTSGHREHGHSLNGAIELDAPARVFRRSMLWTPDRQESSAWSEHVPFAFWLVDVLRPRRIVELGAHNGVSYSALCQAVKTLGLATSCYAIDTWEGDEHAGFYGEDVYREFAAFHDLRYGGFSQLLRSRFDDALDHFEQESIDLLHIDGLHTYDAVRHDYRSWFPKLSTSAVVLFHDTNTRERNFGVHRFWNELASEKLHFSFLHGYGLGVLGAGQDYPDILHLLFGASGDDRVAGEIRDIFRTLGRAVRISSERLNLDNGLSERGGEFVRLRQALSERSGEIDRLRDALLNGSNELNVSRRTLSGLKAEKLQQELAACEARISSLDVTISALKASTCWRITAPLRLVSTTARQPWRIAGYVQKAGAAYLGRAAPRLLPYYRRYLPENVRKVVSALLRPPLRPPSVATSYDDWILKNEKLGDDDRNLIRAHIASFTKKPKFSILMPVYNTPLQYLREAIESVFDQLYQEWELCIADDASTSEEVHDILRKYAQQDGRIKVCFRGANGGISACTNTALEMATGDWIALMDHDDVLAEHALYLVGEAINRDPDLAVIYSDEDAIDGEGLRKNPYFKPSWDYDLFLAQNLISHLGVYRRDLAHQAGGFRDGFDGSQDWDFALRILEENRDLKVHHIPFILYHWRQTPEAFSKILSTRAIDAAQRAVSGHLTRTGQPAEVDPIGRSSYMGVRRTLPVQCPLVSIIIPTKDQHDLLQKCIDGLVNRTNYRHREIIIVDNGSSNFYAVNLIATLRAQPGFAVIDDDGSFNFSRLVNRGVCAASGDICVLLNNDINIINPGWLDELVSHAVRPDVGAVGAKLYYADDTLQHGGVILGLGGVAAHDHKSVPRNSYGYFGRLQLTHGLSCVTAACLAVRRTVYNEVGGFDEKNLTVAFNDVDFCIRIRQAGYKIIWTPHAELYHYESRSRGSDTTPENAGRFSAEIKYMRATWADVLDNDPFYNPNLSLDSEFFEIAATSRVRKPWLAHARSAGCRPL
jgi:glycosyltransferase involved in cell wall biosynthesis